MPSIKTNTKTRKDFYSPAFVKELFNSMASSYEGVNYLTSFGFSVRWRQQFIRALPRTKAPIKVADLMTGQGENWRFIKNNWSQAEITAIDFSEGMLNVAAKRNKKRFNREVKILKEDVLENSVPGEEFDFIVCAFGLKTLNKVQLERLAQETYRMLKPGGKYSFIEVSVPKNFILQKIYLFYLEKVIPLVGRLFLGNPDQYKMLGFYTEKFQNAEHAYLSFKAAGLFPVFQEYFNGCATGFSGHKI